MREPGDADLRDHGAATQPVIGHCHRVPLAALHGARCHRGSPRRFGPQLRGGIAIARRDHRVASAVDHQQRWQIDRRCHRRSRQCPCLAPPAHGAERTQRRMRAARGHARMHHQRAESCRVPRDQQCGHAGAGRQTGHGDPFAIGRIQGAHLIDGGHDQRHFSPRTAGLGVEPVPAALRIGQPFLLRIQHQKALARRDAVHARTGREPLCVLPAAVQHDKQRHPLSGPDAGRAVQPVATRTGRADRHARQPLPGCRGALARRLDRGASARSGLDACDGRRDRLERTPRGRQCRTQRRALQGRQTARHAPGEDRGPAAFGHPSGSVYLPAMGWRRIPHIYMQARSAICLYSMYAQPHRNIAAAHIFAARRT